MQPDHVMVSLGGSSVMSHEGGGGDVANLESLDSWYERLDSAYELKLKDFQDKETEFGENVGMKYRERKGGFTRQVLLFGKAPWKTDEIGL